MPDGDWGVDFQTALSIPKQKGTRVNKKFPGLWGLNPVSAGKADEQSEWASEIIWAKPHYLQMRNLYCQHNLCEAKQPGEYIKAQHPGAEVQSLGRGHLRSSQVASLHPHLLSAQSHKVRGVLRG